MGCLDKGGSRICRLVILAPGEHCVANHDRGDVGVTLPFSRPKIEQASRQPRNRRYGFEASPLYRQGLYRVNGFRGHERMKIENS